MHFFAFFFSILLEEAISEDSSNSDDPKDLIDGILDFPLDLKEDCEDQDCTGSRPRYFF